MTAERMKICDSCGGQKVERSNGPSSYRERLTAPIFERLGEFGFVSKLLRIAIRPKEDRVELVIDGPTKLTAHQARSVANALNTVADIQDQLNNNWIGPGPADAALEREARAEAAKETPVEGSNAQPV